MAINDLGESEPVTLPARCAGFEVRRGGAWTHPGAQRFRGDPYCAIVATGIPEPHAGDLADDIRRGAAVGTVEISAAGIRGGGRHFGDRMDMSYGNGMSLGQRVAFAAPRIERGLLFQRAGYWVAVPDVCGNVTRLYTRVSDGPQAAMAPPLDALVGDPSPGSAPPRADDPLPIAYAAPKRFGGSTPSAQPGPVWAGAPGPLGPGGPLEGPLQVGPQAADPAVMPGSPDRDPGIDPQGAGGVPRDSTPTPVPEPSALSCLLAGGMALVASLARRRRNVRSG